jgi:predicted nucleic acid-binding protein
MSVDCFLDTNVIAYAFSSLPEDAAKRERAERVLRGNHYGISAQELFVVLTRKAAMKLSPGDALTVIENFKGTPCQAVDAGLVVEGIQTSVQHQISYWDGAILAAARRLGAPIVYSEDLNHGQRYGGVQVINPFL